MPVVKLKKPETILVVPDIHIPFEYPNAVEAYLCWGASMKPDRVVFIGDVIDAYTISRFDKNPGRKDSLQKEVNKAQELLAATSVLFSCPIHYMEGNHEDRLRKFLWSKAPHLADIRGLTIPELLCLEEWGIQWHDALDPLRIGGVTFMHANRIRKHAGMTALAISDEREQSIVCGHSHRQGFAWRTSAAGTRFGCEVGCLCNPHKLDYVDSIPNWQFGGALVHVSPDRPASVELVRVLDPGTRNPTVVIGNKSVTLSQLRSK